MSVAAPIVKTASVTGRREVHYDRPEDILADVERLAAMPVVTLGNWTFAQIVGHLAESFHNAIDGSVIAAPWYIKWMAPFMKHSFLTKPLPAGFNMPQAAEEKLIPPIDTSLEQALTKMRDAVARYRRESQRALHGLFGKLTPDEWDRFLCRHAELHLSFVKPA